MVSALGCSSPLNSFHMSPPPRLMAQTTTSSKSWSAALKRKVGRAPNGPITLLDLSPDYRVLPVTCSLPWPRRRSGRVSGAAMPPLPCLHHFHECRACRRTHRQGKGAVARGKLVREPRWSASGRLNH
eukprot:scaffold84885_cov30-Tisochrysis_lutea.AAC.1